MASKLSSSSRFVKPKDIKTCRLCGGAIWLEPGNRHEGYTSREAWYHVGRYPRISCTSNPQTEEPERPLGAGP